MRNRGASFQRKKAETQLRMGFECVNATRALFRIIRWGRWGEMGKISARKIWKRCVFLREKENSMFAEK